MVCSLAVAVGCYSPRATTGAPCSPALANCPDPQTCALVGGSYVCVEGAVPDASIDSPRAIDAPRGLPDAFVPRDAARDAPPPPPPWTLVQVAGSTSPGITIAATGAGHLLLVAIETDTSTQVTTVADNVNDTFVAIPNAHAKASAGSPAFGVTLWAGSTGQGGATSIAIAAPVFYAVVVWEVSGIRSSNPLDGVTTLSDQAATTTPSGAAITTTAAGDFVAAVAIVDNQITGIHAGNAFTNDRTTNGNGWAHLTSSSAPAGTYQAKWDQGTAGVYCAVSAAFFVGP